MKILHTADIHIKGYDDDRWKTLQRLLEIGKKEKIEIFVISGDLFDKGINAEDLRPKMRKLFSGNDFRIVLIPGNHDRDSYTGGVYFGEDTILLTDVDSPFAYKDVTIWGIPFEPIEGERCIVKLRSLAERVRPDTTNIVLYHGELLDAFFSRRDFGDEGEERYMPIKLSYFKDVKVDYVLAGHFHSRFDVWNLEHGGYFVYPGSPISITRREIGRRKVNIFEVGKPPAEYPLDTPYFEERVIDLDPFDEHDPLEIVGRELSILSGEATVILTVKGFINSKALGMSETELVKKLEGIAQERFVEMYPEFRDVAVILGDDLFKSFEKRLEQADYDEEEKRQMRETAIRAMMMARS